MIHQIWSLPAPQFVADASGPEARKQERVLKKWHDKKLMVQILQSHAPDIVRGKVNLTISDQQVTDLFTLVCDNVSAEVRRRRHNFLVDGFIAGQNLLNWQVNIPAKIQGLPREPAPFTPDNFKKLAQLNNHYSKFQESLADLDFHKDHNNYLPQAGRILFSAAVNGALLDPRLLAAVGPAIADNLVAENDLLWLDLYWPDKDKKSPFMRRWFPDPITGLLIIRWRRTGRPWPQDAFPGIRSAAKLVRIFLRHIGIKNNEQFSLPSLCRIAATRLCLELPPFLIHYASRIRNGPTLSASAWARLRLDKVIQKQDEPKPIFIGKGQNKQLAIPDRQLPDQNKIYLQLLRAISKKKTEKEPGIPAVRQKINSLLANRGQMSVILQCLALWFIMQLLSHGA